MINEAQLQSLYKCGPHSHLLTYSLIDLFTLSRSHYKNLKATLPPTHSWSEPPLVNVSL